MAAIGVCDACGLQKPMVALGNEQWVRPNGWHQLDQWTETGKVHPEFGPEREKRELLACSKRCLRKLPQSNTVEVFMY